MANANTGKIIRWENGGIVLVGSDTLLNVVAGTLNYKIQGYEPVTWKDRGVLQDPIAGDQRPVMGGLQIRYTAGSTPGTAGSYAMIPALMNTLSSSKVANVTAAGLLFTFSLTVKIPFYLGATTGDQYVFAKCYLPDGMDFKMQAGADSDLLDLSFVDNELSPTITQY